MKTVAQFQMAGVEDRIAAITTSAKAFGKARLLIAKALAAGALAGDYADGEMNKFAQEKAGVELRREFQGTYEAVKVLLGVIASNVPMTEKQWEKVPNHAHIKISTIMAKYPDALAEACEIATSGKNVVKRINALMKRLKGEPEEPAKNPAGTGESSSSGTGDDSGEASGIQTLEVLPGSTTETIVLRADEFTLSNDQVVGRILREIDSFDSIEACDIYLRALGTLKARIETRCEHIEAEADRVPAAA